MITDLETELNRTLTTEQVTMILDFAIQTAEDRGFVNRYIYQRAIYVFAAVVLFPERKEEITNIIGSDYDIRLAWDALLKDGTIKKMTDDFSNDLEYLGNVAEDWFEDYSDYVHSARGILAMVNEFSGNIVEAAVERLQGVADSNIGDVLKIAESWGLNRNIDEQNSLGEFLEGVNSGQIPVPDSMPNFTLLPKDE